MRFSASVTFAGALLAGGASSTLFGNNLIPPELVDDVTGVGKRATGAGVFKQLIDHSKPELGTFDVRYWWNDEFWAGPGSPVVFFTPGEVAAERYTGYLRNTSITGMFAQAIGAATVVMEHRYWGTSAPFTELTTRNLSYLTLDNSVADTTYFAKNVKFPFDPNGTSLADKAPWVFSGGSYSGALAAYVESLAPGTFWAYHASSAVVQTITDFWQYFYPVQQGMPQNCSSDVSKVIDHVDKVLLHGHPREKQQLKTFFGLGNLKHDDDFASALQNGPWQWQSHDFSSGYSGFFEFCDTVENTGPLYPNATTVPGAEGVGLFKALNGYAKWMKESYLPGSCDTWGSYYSGNKSLDCFDSYDPNAPFYTDYSLDNAANRQWMWVLCDGPFEFWQDGAPLGRPTIVSRLVTPEYWRRQCGLYFKEQDGYTYSLAKGKTADDVNEHTGGWFKTNTTRLTYVNGEWDPWRDATMSSAFRPGGPLQSTPELPVEIIPGGIHCSDLLKRNADVNAGVRKVVDNQISIIKGWVAEFYTQKGINRKF